MEKNLIKKVSLNNGLKLELYDASKKVAGDRWLVKLAAKIEIPVTNYLQGLGQGMDANDIQKTLGRTVIYEKNIERNFIDKNERKSVLNGFCDSITETALAYLSTSNFPKQFIAKKYKEEKKRKSWYQK